MGEMADYCRDMEMEAEAERADEICSWLEFDDKQLKNFVVEYGFYESEYTDLVKSILEFKNSLSKKQRYCLAAYLTDDHRR